MLSQDTEQRAALYEALSSYYAGNLPAGETFIRLTNAYLHSELVLPPKEDDVGFDFNSWRPRTNHPTSPPIG